MRLFIFLVLVTYSALFAGPEISIRDALHPFTDYYAQRDEWPAGCGYKPFMRQVLDLKARVNPDGTIPRGALWQAFEQKQRMPRVTLDEAWTEIGPTEQGGRMTVIRFHPTNHDIMFTGSASGGLFKSVDRGESWFPITDDLPCLNISSLAFDPANPDIMYMGTGEGVYNTLNGLGLFKSVDGGNSWFPTGFSFLFSVGQSCQTVNVDPYDPFTVFTGSYDGLFVSHDGAVTFEHVLSGDVKTIVRDPLRPEIMLLNTGWGFGSPQNGIWRSADNGETWLRSFRGLPVASEMARSVFAFSPTDTGVVYCGISGTFAGNGTAMLGLYRSTDSGESWTQQMPPRDAPNRYYFRGHYAYQGWFALALAVKPDNSDVLFSAGLDIHRSTTQGREFDRMSEWSLWRSDNPGTRFVHADMHDLVFDPDDPNTIWAASDGGLYRSTDLGENWYPKSYGLGTYQFYRIKSSLQNPLIIYGGTHDNGTLKWSGSPVWRRILDSDGGDVAVDPVNDSIVYMERPGGNLHRSDNGGISHQDLRYGGGPWVMPVVLDPFDRNTLYVTSIDHFYSGDTLLGSVWVSHERGDDRYEWDGERTIHINSWSQLGNPVGGYMQTLCCAPLVPGRLYAGSDHAVHRYDPADSTWRNVTGNLPDRWSNRVVASPHEPDGVYVVLGTWGIPHVWHSTNAGEAWIDISSNLPDASCNDLFIDPRDENTLFLATDIGLFMTNNGGVSWNNFGNGLPNVRCEDFDWQPAAGLLRVGTHGRGVWEIYLGSNDLELLYPNGVADLIVGEQLPIRWSGSDFGGDVRIEINRSFPEGVWEPIFDSTPNDGVEDWTVSGANGAHVRLRITHLSRADLSDTTNADAQLGAPWLNFTFPLPGREAIAGVYVTVPIQFGFLPGHDLEFYLNTDYPVGEWKWVSRTYSTHSTAQLSLSYALPSTHARLRGQVERVGQAPVILYMSNSDFTIREPYVNILSPRPGDTLYIGEQVNISAACDPEITRIYLDLQRIGADPEFVSLNDVFNGDDVSLTSALWTVTGPEWEHCRITANVGPGYTFVSPGEFVIAGPRDRSNIAGIPSEFNIGQPYPNPFNSRCSFSLELPQTGNVVARVYNRLGQEVATLFDGPLNAGYQHVTFDGSGMASGIYFIQVETPDLRRVLKVALIR